VHPPSVLPYALNQALPDDVAAGGRSIFTRYQRYPVFSARWFVGRGWRIALIILPFCIMSGFGYAILTGSYRTGVVTFGYTLTSIAAVCFFGPFLASLVRPLRLSPKRERVWIVIAVLVGMGLAYGVEMWANVYMEELIKSLATKNGLFAKPKVQGIEKVIAHAIGYSWNLIYYGCAGGGLALWAYFSEQRRFRAWVQRREIATLQSEKSQSELRLGVLQAQVEPHFLFNTLASVRALVRQQPEQAEATLDALVDYLRASIPRMRDETAAIVSNLGQQLDMCTSYLEVMRLRTAGRLQYRVEADADLRALAFPPMLLITLVENAIKHGIEPKPGRGQVEIVAEREGDTLRIAVIDDGLGLRLGVGGGLGLANVRAQLDALYSNRATFEIRSQPDGGVCAELRIPIDVDARESAAR
jgi:two-component sensor histidine kinase